MSRKDKDFCKGKPDKINSLSDQIWPFLLPSQYLTCLAVWSRFPLAWPAGVGYTPPSAVGVWGTALVEVDEYHGCLYMKCTSGDV